MDSGCGIGSPSPPCDPIARKTLPRPPHPRPAFLTIMIRPSCGVGWREFVEMICPTGEAKYFCKGGVDTPVNKPTDGQITRASLVVRVVCFRSCPRWKSVRHSTMCKIAHRGMTPEFEPRAASGELRAWLLYKVCYLNKCNCR
jgi:hypothetical protein